MSAAKAHAEDWRDLVSTEVDAGLRVIEADQELAKIKDSCHILVANDFSPAEVLNAALDKGYRHTIQSTSTTFTKELVAAAKLAIEPERILKFPLSAILNPMKCDAESEKNLSLISKDFSLAREKSVILRQIEEAIATKVRSTGLKADIVTVSDELLTNAIFNAPFVDLQNSNPGESRDNSGISMTEGKCGHFFLGADEERIVIGCRDPYGTLNVKKLLERVRNCYLRSVAATMNMNGAGGAGIGSFMVFNSSCSYFVATEQLKTTVVCAVMSIKGSGRARQEAPKSLHIINLEETLEETQNG
jgi:hypothetical protein